MFSYSCLIFVKQTLASIDVFIPINKLLADVMWTFCSMLTPSDITIFGKNWMDSTWIWRKEMTMSKKQKGFILVLGFVGVICFSYYSFFSSTAILNNVKQYKGYDVQIVQEKYPIELFIEPEWFSLEKEQTQKVNKV